MKQSITRRVKLLIIDVEDLNSAKNGLDAFESAIALAGKAIAAGVNLDEIITTDTGTTRISVELEDAAG